MNKNNFKLNICAVSLNVIKSTLQIVKQNPNFEIALLASRRQIESGNIGVGYVNNFSTKDYINFLNSNSYQEGGIELVRDHGGPYQRPDEIGMDFDAAIENIRISYRDDIEYGFNTIHIEPEKAIPVYDPAKSLDQFIDISKHLLKISHDTGKKLGSHIPMCYEIGTDEGVAKYFSIDDWKKFLDLIVKFCEENKIDGLTYFSMPLGTKVANNNNHANGLNSDELNLLERRIFSALSLANNYGLSLKMHNADFLTDRMLDFYSGSGIVNINIGPELGVLETKALHEFLRLNGMEHLSTEFSSMAYASKLWEKWFSHEIGNEDERALAAGHYLFASPDFLVLKEKIGNLNNLDLFLQGAIEKRLNYLLRR